MSGFWQQALTITRRDLTIEGRAGEVVGVVLPFAAIAVFVVPLATDALESRLTQLGFPIFWLVALLFGMQISLRQTGTETANQRRQLALLGLDPAARFIGRSLAASALTLLVLVVSLPLVVVFYNPPSMRDPWVIAPVIVLFAAGLSMLTTMAGDVTVGLRTRSVLAPLLVAPLAVPLMIGASQTVEALVHDRTILTWILLLVVVDLGLLITGFLASRPLEDAAI
ncbi:MAG: heme exporter protein CcmB [Acidimicrobiia bacterium]|nr:heme exporter protein CcmB [Acidimicrobiia bacterium]